MRNCRLLLLAACLAAAVGAQKPLRLGIVNIHDSTVTLVDPAGTAEPVVIPVGVGPHEIARRGSVAVVPSYAGSDVFVVDLARREVIRKIPLTEQRDDGRTTSWQRPHGVCFVAPTRVAVTAEMQARLVIVDIEEGRVVTSYPSGVRRPHMVITDPGREYLFCTSKPDGAVGRVHIESGSVEVLQTGKGAQGMAWHPARAELWVANIGTHSITVVDPVAWKKIAELPSGRYPVRLAFTADGRHVFGSDYEGGTVSVYDVEKRTRIDEIALPGLAPEAVRERPLPSHRRGFPSDAPLPVGLLMHQDRAWVACTRSYAIHEIDLASRRIVRTLKAGREPDGMILIEAAAKPPWPEARDHHGGAFDAKRGRLVIFGGNGRKDGASTFLDDTWEWDRAVWRRIVGDGPEARSSLAMTYDPTRGVVVLFGGIRPGKLFGDTWTFDGRSWTRHDVTGPGPRYSPALAYDPRRDRVLLFGGRAATGVMNDTWAWNGSKWSRLAEEGAPRARARASLCWDPKRGEMVLFGGGGRGFKLADTWRHVDDRWTRVETGEGPAARTNQGMAWSGDALAVFGGGVDGAVDELWSLRGDVWGRVPRVEPWPAARDMVALVRDPGRERVILFGGRARDRTALDDLWVRDAKGWRRIGPPR